MSRRINFGGINQDPSQTPGDGPDILDLVLDDLRERARLGVAKYGYPLKPRQNRDPLIDLYQELLDAVMYLRQFLEERYSETPSSSC